MTGQCKEAANTSTKNTSNKYSTVPNVTSMVLSYAPINVLYENTGTGAYGYVALNNIGYVGTPVYTPDPDAELGTNIVEAGTYVYKLYEEKGTAEYVTYDDKVYTVTIVVEDDMEGSLAVTSQFDSSKFVFKNTYKNPEVVYTGDNASIITMLTMFVLSAGVILMSFKKMYKR